MFYKYFFCFVSIVLLSGNSSEATGKKWAKKQKPAAC